MRRRPGGEPVGVLGVRLLVATVLAATLLGFTSVQAQAGRWVLLSCRQPDGSPAPTDGWSATATGPVGPDSGAGNTCATGGALTLNSSGEAQQSAYAGPQWEFTAPAGSTISGGALTATLSSPHGQAWLGEPNATYDSADVLANCQYNLACGTGGTLNGTFPITHTGATHIYATAVCVGPYEGATSCPVYGASDAALALSAAQIELSTAANPAGSGFGGAAIAGEARGTQPVSFTAYDTEGPGVYLVTAAADGAVLYSGTPDRNGGSCAPSATIDGLAGYTTSQPCRTVESVDLPIQTNGLADGKHELTLIVTDAAGDSSIIYDAQISTHNAPASTSLPTTRSPARLQAGDTLEAEPGGWSEPEGSGALSSGVQWQGCNADGEVCRDIPGATGTAYTASGADVGHTLRVLASASNLDGLATAASASSAIVEAPAAGGADLLGLDALQRAGIANGSGASANATLTLQGPARISRIPTRSAVRVRGTLTGSDRAPIGGATLDVLESSGDSGARTLTQTRTTSTGAFEAAIPVGGSRVLTVAYRAFDTDVGYAASASVAETVSARVTLRVSPRLTSPSGMIVLSGAAGGPVPPDGVIVELLVRYRGTWEPFRTPRTDSHGRFRVRYQFQGAVGRFPFRAEVPGGQARYSYGDGLSNVVTVNSR